MKISTLSVIIFVIAVLFMTTACSMGEKPQNDEIAVVPLKNGGYVKFLAPEPGEIIVAVLSEDPLEGLGTLSPIELYESLTGNPAPQEIIEASQIEEEAPAEEEEEVTEEASAPDKLINAEDNAESSFSPTRSISFVGRMDAEEFVRRYGQVYGDGADYIWTNAVSSGWAKSKAYNVSSTAVTNSGEIIHIIKYRNSSLAKWHTKYSQTVPTGYRSYYMYGTNKKKRKKCEIKVSPNYSSVWYHVVITFNK